MWNSTAGFEDIRYEKTDDGAIAKITINRPEVRNAFRPLTVKELLQAFELAHQLLSSLRAIIPSPHHMLVCPANQQFVCVSGRHL